MCVSISQETVELNRVHLGPENGPNYIILKNLEPKQQTSHVHQYPKNKSLQWKEWAARSMSNSMAASGVARCVQDSVGSSFWWAHIPWDQSKLLFLAASQLDLLKLICNRNLKLRN